jgi:hypothetical protein
VQTINKLQLKVIISALILTIFTFQSVSYSQGGFRVYEEPGGGSGGSTQTQDSNDNTTIYVIGGLVIAGVLAYALFFKEKKKDADTTASLKSNLIYSEVVDLDNADENIRQVKDKMPVDIFLGIRNNEAVMNDRIYQVGLRVKL